MKFIYPCSNKPKKIVHVLQLSTKTDEKLFICLNICTVFRGIKRNLFPEYFIFLILDEDHLCRWQISEREKQDSLGTKLVVKFKGPIMGKLGPGKHVVLVCQNLNLLGNKATVNLSVADTYRFT